MKLVIDDPMPALRQQAEAQINAHFDQISAASLQRDLEHHAKRQAAALVMQGGDPSQSFEDAGSIEGHDVFTFAKTILAKPDEMMRRAIARRRAVLSVRAAKSPTEIDGLLKSLIES